MLEASVVLGNRLGLHARAAAKLVRTAKDFDCSIMVVGEDGVGADAKSILSILALSAGKGTRLMLTADGRDEENAIEQIQKLFAANFGEEQ